MNNKETTLDRNWALPPIKQRIKDKLLDEVKEAEEQGISFTRMELAEKYDISEASVYRIIRKSKEKGTGIFKKRKIKKRRRTNVMRSEELKREIALFAIEHGIKVALHKYPSVPKTSILNYVKIVAIIEEKKDPLFRKKDTQIKIDFNKSVLNSLEIINQIKQNREETTKLN